MGCSTAGCGRCTRVRDTAGSRMKISRFHSSADQLSKLQLRNTFQNLKRKFDFSLQQVKLAQQCRTMLDSSEVNGPDLR